MIYLQLPVYLFTFSSSPSVFPLLFTKVGDPSLGKGIAERLSILRALKPPPHPPAYSSNGDSKSDDDDDDDRETREGLREVLRMSTHAVKVTGRYFVQNLDQELHRLSDEVSFTSQKEGMRTMVMGTNDDDDDGDVGEKESGGGSATTQDPTGNQGSEASTSGSGESSDSDDNDGDDDDDLNRPPCTQSASTSAALETAAAAAAVAVDSMESFFLDYDYFTALDRDHDHNEDATPKMTPDESSSSLNSMASAVYRQVVANGWPLVVCQSTPSPWSLWDGVVRSEVVGFALVGWSRSMGRPPNKDDDECSLDSSSDGNKHLWKRDFAAWLFQGQNEALGRPMERILFERTRALNTSSFSSSSLLPSPSPPPPPHSSPRLPYVPVRTFAPLMIDSTRNAENDVATLL
jgi:hypothetical protein